jgi:uncharacterized UBP type Zn finger protein
MTAYVVAVSDPSEATCTHLDTIRDVSPSTEDGCEDCLREGSQWVHLRECLQCGHVGCCDSSPRRHASAHFRSASHPVVRSFQPGEDWAWCYADDLMLRPADSL